MPTANEEFLFNLLRACAERAPQPLYPVHFAAEANIDRDILDDALDELRRRGLLHLTEWVKGSGQGCALTEAGQRALVTRSLAPAAAPASSSAAPEAASYGERAQVVRSAFIPRMPYATRILLIANIAYFAFGAFYASQNDLDVADYLQGTSTRPKYTTNFVLMKLGALHPDLVFPPANHPEQRPEFERIFLYAFLHIGLLHLFMNMYFLYALGPLIEAMWGRYRFLSIYLIAGITGGCMVLLVALLHPEERAGLTAGASGALYGLFAAFIVWYSLNRNYLPPGLSSNLSRNIGVNLMLLIAVNFFPGISWQGHLGGAIGGFLTALLLHVQRFYPQRAVRLLALLGVPMVPVGFFLLVLWEAHWFQG